MKIGGMLFIEFVNDLRREMNRSWYIRRVHREMIGIYASNFLFYIVIISSLNSIFMRTLSMPSMATLLAAALLADRDYWLTIRKILEDRKV